MLNCYVYIGCSYSVHKKCLEGAKYLECPAGMLSLSLSLFLFSLVSLLTRLYIASAHKPMSTEELELFENQVAGHKGRASMLKDQHTILKYLSLPLSPFSLPLSHIALPFFKDH